MQMSKVVLIAACLTGAFLLSDGICLADEFGG
jgi:hypothetical protein